eukprot:COSAG02_NODE_4716_length_5060_cov_2.509978_8_plen_123_part_00
MSAQTLGQLDCRSYVYVLECANPSGEEHDHWYVGVASPGHLSTRLDQHWVAKAARYTRTHRPVRVAAIHRGPASGDAVVRLERETTLQIMRECIERHGEDGWKRVRGGPWCSVDLDKKPPGL